MEKMDDTSIPFVPERCYHLFNRGNNKQNIFYQEKNYFYFLKKYGDYMNPYLDTYAYCLLPNHFHVLMKVKKQLKILQRAIIDFPTVKRHVIVGWKVQQAIELEDETTNFSLPALLQQLSDPKDLERVAQWVISEKLRRLLMGYAKAINKQEHLEGSLFRKKIRRKLVDDLGYFTFLIWYIHHNPVHHNIFHSLQDYHHSSYRSYLSTSPTQLKREVVLNWFGGKDNFVQYHKENTLVDEEGIKFWIE